VREGEDAAPGAWSPAQRAWAFAVLVLLTLLLALWGAFLVPFRVGDTVVPVSWAVAAVGNLAVGRAGARLAGAAGALVPGGVWLVVVVALSSQRSEGDLVVPGSVVGLVFLLTGVLASAAACGSAVLRTGAPRGAPEGWTGRR
jgi:hypothetical protein